jgi:hypothetical protein
MIKVIGSRPRCGHATQTGPCPIADRCLKSPELFSPRATGPAGSISGRHGKWRDRRLTYGHKRLNERAPQSGPAKLLQAQPAFQIFVMWRILSPSNAMQ